MVFSEMKSHFPYPKHQQYFLDKKKLSNENLSPSFLRGSILINFEFLMVNLQNSDFGDTIIKDTTFYQCDLRGIDFSSSTFHNCSFFDCRFDETNKFPLSSVPEGELILYKIVRNKIGGYKKEDYSILKVLVPAESKRTSTIPCFPGERNAASIKVDFLKVLEGNGYSLLSPLFYKEGEIVRSPKFNSNPLENENGLFCVPSREHAEEQIKLWSCGL